MNTHVTISVSVWVICLLCLTVGFAVGFATAYAMYLRRTVSPPLVPKAVHVPVGDPLNS